MKHLICNNANRNCSTRKNVQGENFGSEVMQEEGQQLNYKRNIDNRVRRQSRCGLLKKQKQQQQ